MNFLHKVNIVSRVFKSLIFGQVPNYAIVYVDGRCNMHCDFCCYAAMDAEIVALYHHQIGAMF